MRDAAAEPFTSDALRCPVCDGGVFRAGSPGAPPTCVNGCDQSARSVLTGLGDGWVFYPPGAVMPPLTRTGEGGRRG